MVTSVPILSKGVTGLISLVAIPYMFHWFTNVDMIWSLTTMAVGIFLCLCYVDDPLVSRLIGLPLTFRLEENWGARSYAMQSITQLVLHHEWYSKWTQWTIVVEAPLWFILILHYGGCTSWCFTLCLLVAQACSYRDRKLSPILIFVWMIVAMGSLCFYYYCYYTTTQISTIVYMSKLSLLSLPLWRCTTAAGQSSVWTQPSFSRIAFPCSTAPPPMSLSLSTVLLSPIAQFAASLPFRLFNIVVLEFLQQQLGLRPWRLLPLSLARVEAGKIRRLGNWSASTATAHFVDPWVRTSKANLDPRLRWSWIPFQWRNVLELVYWSNDGDIETCSTATRRRPWILNRQPRLFGLEHLEQVSDKF